MLNLWLRGSEGAQVIVNWGGQLNVEVRNLAKRQNFTFLQVAMSNLVVSHEPWRQSENLAKKSWQEEKNIAD